MNDESVKALARRAGLAVEWRDYADKPHRVSIAALRRILFALGLPCDTAGDLQESERQLAPIGLPPLITATAGKPINLPIAAEMLPRTVRVTSEDGTPIHVDIQPSAKRALLTPIETPGYHRLELGEECITLAIAPPRCFTVADAAPGDRLWGLAVQAYGLRSRGDCGIGDMAGVGALAAQATKLKADALALSPMHALFADDASLFSPYAPSSRLFYNPLYADPQALFGRERVEKAAAAIGALSTSVELDQRPLIDWPQSARIKTSLLRALFEEFCATDLAGSATAPAADFAKFLDASKPLLQEHALFEALHAARGSIGASAWSWRQWPAPFRDPRGDAVQGFARTHEKEFLFHCFLQWVADRSLAAAQQAAKQAGMRIGLIADLAVGMSGDGSHAWTNQTDILGELEIGAPPDLYNQKGQNWGLTTFSPQSLRTGGFAPYIATLRACLRHAGGVRIDHAMGLLRLWVIPRGADPRDGAYLSYPIDDLLRLTALESYRHRAIVIGEDLGTVPAGFRERLSEVGIYGMRVLWFERRRKHFIPPSEWPMDAIAMTSTHDLPTIAGWWRGHDIQTRRQLGLVADPEQEQAVRDNDRRQLWHSFRQSEAAHGEMPPPTDAGRVADAAVNFIAQTPSQLALLPLEDALGLEDQPNLPGTIDEHPNWRRRYPGQAQELLDASQVRKRLQPLARRGGR
jgi:4-alpha-glucanotransferase